MKRIRNLLVNIFGKIIGTIWSIRENRTINAIDRETENTLRILAEIKLCEDEHNKIESIIMQAAEYRRYLMWHKIMRIGEYNLTNSCLGYVVEKYLKYLAICRAKDKEMGIEP
jgi:hypothetical protein